MHSDTPALWKSGAFRATDPGASSRTATNDSRHPRIDARPLIISRVHTRIPRTYTLEEVHAYIYKLYIHIGGGQRAHAQTQYRSRHRVSV